MEIKDKIKFTDVTEVLIKNFDKMMYDFKSEEFIIFFIHNTDEVETSISKGEIEKNLFRKRKKENHSLSFEKRYHFKNLLFTSCI